MKIEAKMFKKKCKNVSKICENWSKNDSKLPLGGFLGPLLGALGAMWVPRGASMPKSEKKGIVIDAFLGPHFGTFLVLCRTLKHFLERFFWVSV